MRSTKTSIARLSNSNQKSNSDNPVFSVSGFLIIILFSSLGYANKTNKKTTITRDNPVQIEINLTEEKQTIHSFGASDCWTMKYIGNWTDINKKNQIADLLFSTDTTSNGNPKGIGLSLWRFNIGSGSFEQGKESDIRDEWRREECFLNPDGSYNWEKQKGQQWFLNEARKRGVQYTLGFSLTPPTFMTLNGRAYNKTNLPNLNIKPAKLDDYAEFMAKVSDHFKFDYLSPVNEPQWFWGRDRISQEGTQATNSEIADLVKWLSLKLSANGAKSKIIVGESGQWDFLYSKNEDGRGDQIKQFFSPSSHSYIANLPGVKHAISGHSYFTTCPDNYMIEVRRKIADKVKETDPQLEVWQTEFGILENICNRYKGAPRNTGIDYGLYVASVIYHDLTIANVTSWQWWLAASPYNYSDALIYINDPSGKINPKDCKTDGIIHDSKQLWAFGNYARFVRPGMKRIGTSVKGITGPVEAASSLMVSAYKDEELKRIVIVIINPEQKEKKLQLKDNYGKLNLKNGCLNIYTTDSESNLKKSVVRTDEVKIGGRSVITLTGAYL